MADDKGGVPGWISPNEWKPTAGGARRRDPPYARAIGWAIVVWIVSLGVAYVVAEVLGAPRLSGWVGFAGFLLSFWVGGRRAGITGRNEWTSFIVGLSCFALVATGFAACVGAMAVYG